MRSGLEGPAVLSAFWATADLAKIEPLDGDRARRGPVIGLVVSSTLGANETFCLAEEKCGPGMWETFFKLGAACVREDMVGVVSLDRSGYIGCLLFEGGVARRGCSSSPEGRMVDVSSAWLRFKRLAGENGSPVLLRPRLREAGARGILLPSVFFEGLRFSPPSGAASVGSRSALEVLRFRDLGGGCKVDCVRAPGVVIFKRLGSARKADAWLAIESIFWN